MGFDLEDSSDRWESLLSQIEACRECERLWSTSCTRRGISHPLTQGSAHTQILIISESPSKPAWQHGVMFGSSNPTYEDYRIKIFGVKYQYFNARHFCWTQVANCTAEESLANNRMRRVCWKKFGVRILNAEGKQDWQLIVLLGRAAMAAMDIPGKITNVLEKEANQQRPLKRGSIEMFVLSNPGRSNTRLKNPSSTLSKLQRKVVRLLQDRVKKILGPEAMEDSAMTAEGQDCQKNFAIGEQVKRCPSCLKRFCQDSWGNTAICPGCSATVLPEKCTYKGGDVFYSDLPGTMVDEPDKE